MKLNFKTYQLLKAKNYLLKNNLILFSYNSSQKSFYGLLKKQEMHRLSFSCYKIYNSTTTIIKKTIFKNFLQIIHSSLFLLKTNKIHNKLLININLLFKNLQNIEFYVHSLKLNNKFYSIFQLKNINSLKYNNSIKIFYQFVITNLKICNNLRYK